MGSESKPFVVILDSAVVPDAEECELEREILSPHAEIRHLYVKSTEDLVDGCKEADAIILWHHVTLDGPVLRQLKRCRVIVRNGVGFDNVDVRAAAQLGIPVCNVPDYGTEEVADHAMGLALYLVRNLGKSWAEVQKGIWNWASARPIRRSRTQVFGILGCGRIGTATALRAKAFGFQTVFHDPYLPDGIEKALSLERTSSLEDLLACADVLSLHAPLTQETRHLIDATAFSRMKRGAILVNTARGPVVNEADLVVALESGHLYGAGLDVVETEPSPHPRLLSLPNCIVTPHSAFYSEDSWIEMRSKSAKTVLRALQHQPLRNIVNED